MDRAVEPETGLKLFTPEDSGDAAFEYWVGRRVVMQVALGQFQMSLRGMFLKSRMDSLLIRLDHGLEIEIPKEWILAIEEGRCTNPSHESTQLKDLS